MLGIIFRKYLTCHITCFYTIQLSTQENNMKRTLYNVNVSVLTLVFTKDQCFYLNYHKVVIKSYVLDVY